MAARTPTLSEIGNDRAYFKFKFIEQPHVPMVLVFHPKDGVGPAFKEVPLQSIIDCRTPLDNLSETQSRKLTDTYKRHSTWMHSSATIRLGSGGSQFMSNFVFQGRIGLNAEGNSMATFKCIVKRSRWYQTMVVVIEQRCRSRLTEETPPPPSATAPQSSASPGASRKRAYSQICASSSLHDMVDNPATEQPTVATERSHTEPHI